MHSKDISFADNNTQKIWDIISKHESDLQSKSSHYYARLAIIRFLIENFFVAAHQYFGAKVSMIDTSMPINLAAGTACIFVFLRGYWILPGIWLGVLLAFFQTFGFAPVTWFYAAAISLQAAIIFHISWQHITPSLVFYQKKVFLKFIFFIAVIYAMISPWNISKLWLYQWLTNINGVLVISLAVAALDAFYPDRDILQNRNNAMLIILSSLFCGVVLGLIFSFHMNSIIIFMLLHGTLLYVIGYYYGWCGASAAVFITGLLMGFECEYIHINLSLLQILLLVEMVSVYFATCRMPKL